MAKVDVFGTLHADRPGKVRTELTEFCEDADVFFVESPREEPDDDDERAMTLRNPVMRITGWIIEFVWGFLGFLLTRNWGPVDGHVTELVSQEQGIEIEPVDLNLVRRAIEVPIWITILSWFLLLLAFILFVSGVLFSLVFAIWAVVVGFAPAVPFAYWTLSDRNEQIAENIEHILSTEEDVQHGCLVVGRRHMPGVIDHHSKTDVEVGETHKSKLLRRNT